jgi:hypothetical protein
MVSLMPLATFFLDSLLVTKDATLEVYCFDIVGFGFGFCFSRLAGYSTLETSVSVHMEMSRIIFDLFFLDSIPFYIFTECHEQIEHCKGE